MTTLVLETEPVAVKITFQKDTLMVHLGDDRTLSIPLSWYPRLLNASEEERKSWRLLGGGYAIEWQTLDEHIGVEGLLAGRRSSESQASLETWLASRR
jgi:Protein of unknown function (DUF2442)